MTKGALKTPQFQPGQPVRFVGGSGIVKNSKFEFEQWTYLVEMDMGPEPMMGRIGYETAVLLFESDLARAIA